MLAFSDKITDLLSFRCQFFSMDAGYLKRLLLQYNQHLMSSINSTCFVCKKPVTSDSSEINQVVNMPVCFTCKGTEQEKAEEKEVLDSLADGFVCGCI